MALLVGAGLLAFLLVLSAGLGIAAILIAPRLPGVAELSDYRPKLPLQVYAADGSLIGEFGEERRRLTRFADVPQRMKDAVLAAEDARFYSHGGLDALGFARAALAALSGGRLQGASTITMQVARNVYLSSDRTLSRKACEILLALRLERQLGKDQILEIYLNQIYLGQHAWGFAAAADTYFGKPLGQLTIAEAAMLAGLPKAPAANNPLANPRRARARQLYVIERMLEKGFISAAEAAAARQEPLHLRDPADPGRLHAEHAVELVRQAMQAQYGDAIYTSGMKVYTTLVAREQAAAVQALRRGILDFEHRQPYRGPEGFVELPGDAAPGDAIDDAVDAALAAHPDGGELLAAVVLQASTAEVVAQRSDGETLRIRGEGLKAAGAALSAQAPAALRIRRGALIRIAKNASGAWEIVQWPEVDGAFVALDPKTGDIRALVGGFDWSRSRFNHATQAYRQPGSSFKPFVYSAALEKGFAPGTLVNDAPWSAEAADGAPAWAPKNFDGRYEGPITLRRALQESRNTVALRVLQSIGVDDARDWAARFGFERERQPEGLSLALGAGGATPLQMAAGYAVFANGGFRVEPRLIVRVTDLHGRVLMESASPPLDESRRAIPARNAFVMASLLQSVVASGGAQRAHQALGRDDLYGKTGTSNDSVDAWFAGFQPSVVGVAWVGHDTPRRIGVRGETGASLALPIWIGFMRSALQGVPPSEPRAPEGVVRVDGEWYFDDYAPGRCIASLGLDAAQPIPSAQDLAGMPVSAPAAPAERDRILELFRF